MDYITQPQGGRELICSEGGEILIRTGGRITAEPGAIVTGFAESPATLNACRVTYTGEIVLVAPPNAATYPFDTTVYDVNNNMREPGEDDKIFIPEDGTYIINMYFVTQLNGNGAYICQLAPVVNGVLPIVPAIVDLSGPSLAYHQATYIDQFSTGDTIGVISVWDGAAEDVSFHIPSSDPSNLFKYPTLSVTQIA